MVRRAVAEFDAIDGPFLRKLRGIERGINNFEKSSVAGFNRVERGVDSIVASAGRLRTISGIIAGGFGVNIATNFIDQAAQIRNALREAGDTSEETFERVFQASVRSLSGLNDFTRGVQRIQKAVAGTQTLEQTIRQVETLNKLFAISGRTTQERSSTLIQFSQALQASQLGGEELRAIRENAPIELTRAIAREAGGTINDLKALAKQGVLTSDVMIRALNSLEEEADARFGNVQVTIADAAKVFQSGALIVTEAFDKGLGGSATTVSGLIALGDLLSDNAEAAEKFGEAVKIAGVALITSFAARRISNISQAFRDLAAARTAELAASAKQEGQARRNEQRALRTVAVAQGRVTSLQREGVASAALGKQIRTLEKAEVRYQGAQERRLAATQRVITAQQQMVLSTRALATAGGALRGVFNFFGGWVGILLTATAVITTLRSNVETTAERFERLTDSTAKLEGVTDSAVAVMERLSQAIDERGEKSLAASDKIIAATINEFESKKKLVELERVQEQKLQAERVRELNALKERRDLIEGELQANLEIYRSAREGLNSAGIDQINKAISDALVDANQEAVELDRNIKGLEASISIAADSIRKSGEIIGTTFDPTGPVEYSARIDAATKKVTEFVEKNITSAERQQRITEELSNARAVLVAEYGEEAEIVNRLDEAMRRFQGELSKATGETDGLTNAAIRLNNALQNIANANLNVRDQIAVARARLQAAEQGADSVTVSAVGEAQEVSQRLQKLGATPDRIKQAYDQTLELNKELGETNRKVNEALNPATGGSSGGGGAGTPVAGEIDEIEREALAFVQSMQTQQERLIDQTSRLKEVRAKLVQQFGEESTAVRQLDVAMERFRETSFNTFDGLLDRATQLATEVSSVTDFVSQLIAEMIRLNGADAFKSLFSGGGISGFLNELVGIGTEAVSGIILNASDGGGITPTINTPNIEPGSLSPTLNSQQVVNVTPPAGFQAQTRQSQSGRQVDIGFTKAVVSAMGTQTGKASITNNFGISQTPKG